MLSFGGTVRPKYLPVGFVVQLETSRPLSKQKTSSLLIETLNFVMAANPRSLYADFFFDGKLGRTTDGLTQRLALNTL
jgi:hypothetical protein